MDGQIGRCMQLYFLIFIWHSIDSRTLLSSNHHSHDSTNEKQTSFSPSSPSFASLQQYRATISPSLADRSTTVHSNATLPPLITKPNSYLYNPADDEDDDSEQIVLNRVKRDPVPFVCKSNRALSLSLYQWQTNIFFQPMVIFLIVTIVESIIFAPREWTQQVSAPKELPGIRPREIVDGRTPSNARKE